MFNLLMFNADWVSDRVTVLMERMLEYTSDQLTAKFRNDSGNILLDDLTALPCLFCKEGKTDETAYVGKINRIQASGGNYR